jgi:RNA polymerase sigma-70 factor (ECF subfamily)
VFTFTDEQLIKKALTGNKKAWFGLLSRYEKMVFNYAVRMTGNPNDGKDLMQDIFISVFNSLQSYTGSGSFKGWLYRIAHFRCMDFYRSKRPDLSLDDIPEIVEPVCKHSPELHAQATQSQLQIQTMMQGLPFNQRIVVELKFFSQFTFDEIAEQLGISPNTVKSRLYSALARLKSALEVENVRTR